MLPVPCALTPPPRPLRQAHEQAYAWGGQKAAGLPPSSFPEAAGSKRNPEGAGCCLPHTPVPTCCREGGGPGVSLLGDSLRGTREHPWQCCGSASSLWLLPPPVCVLPLAGARGERQGCARCLAWAGEGGSSCSGSGSSASRAGLFTCLWVRWFIFLKLGVCFLNSKVLLCSFPNKVF